MDMATSERPGVDERYQTAGNTSDLSVEAERGGAADVIIAAGWSPSRVGMALLRLHSEWDAAAKPQRMTEAQILLVAEQFRQDEVKARASALARGKPYTPQGRAESRARAQANVWFARELRLLAQGLRSRAGVLEQIHAWALLKDIPSDDVGPALFHWLHRICPICDGHGLRRTPDAPALSAKQCRACNGTGNTPPPNFHAARIQSWLDDCCQKARTSLKNRLHSRE